MSAKSRKSKPMARGGDRLVLRPPVVGYAANKFQAQQLLAAGISPVFMEGADVNAFAQALKFFRKRRGTLAICTLALLRGKPIEGRVFGDRRADVVKAFTAIERAKVKIFDLEHKTDALFMEHNERALTAAARFNRIGDHRTARRRGAMGGKAKGEAAAARRKAADPHGLIYRIALEPEISKTVKRRLLKGICSLATALRHAKKDKP